MNVKQLKQELEKFDESSEILLNDEMLDNLLPLKSVEKIETCNEPFLLININYGEDKDGE